MKMKSIFFIILSCFQLVENANNRSSNKGATTLIIMGANGDLAKRKIWPSVQELIFRNLVDTSLLHIYAASRQPTQTTIDNLNHYFKHLSCATLKDFNENCTELNHKIASIVTPCSLKIKQDDEKLHHFINSRLTKENLYEAARIFYLSVPPFAYTGIAQNIDRYQTCQLTRILRETHAFGQSLTLTRKHEDVSRISKQRRCVLIFNQCQQI